MNLATPTCPPSTLEIPEQLREYQRTGVAFLLERDSALLADEMGLGKTVQIIVAVKLLLTSGNATRVLVVVPRALQSNWVREFSVWAPDILVRRVEGRRSNRISMYYLPLPVIVATYDQILNDSDELDNGPKFDVVILDEAQRIKNVASKTSVACRGIPRLRSWTLTGTPLENSPDDIVSIFAFIRRGLLSQGATSAEISKEIVPYFLRRTKDEVLSGLPPIIVQTIELELQHYQLYAYQNEWERCTQGLEGASYAQMFAAITKLKQLCNFEPSSGESVKFEALQCLLENLSTPSDKIIIFSQYVRTLKWIYDRLRNFSVRLYHGGLHDTEREEVLDWFKTSNNPSILLMSLKAGGVGLNLQCASTVVLYDQWWNPAVEKQAINRAHRFGRLTPLHVIRFLALDTIEERIASILTSKTNLFDAYVEGAESAPVLPLNKDQLRVILRLPPQRSSSGTDTEDKE
jgi:SNF2 family DNA or RNA helicase